MSYVRYSSFIELAGLSAHVHQLERRMSKYPDHFKTEKGILWMSRELALALVNYHLAVEELAQVENKALFRGAGEKGGANG